MIQLPFSQQITFLSTRNLKETAHFYEGILQFPLTLDQGTCRIYQVSSDGYLGFCQSEQAPQAAPGVILTLVTEAVDDWHCHLLKRGVVFEKPPTHNPKYNIYHCFLRDPNGYLIEIQRFEDPRWPSSRFPSSMS
jgi:catechol 2,3-dioxygenase-like lactoylglutathione lyase family enzyme